MIASVSGRRRVISRALAGLGRDVDRAAHALDRALDDVHADAAARQRRDLLRGRKPGLEDQLIEFGVGQHGAGGDQAAFLGLGANALGVEAASVVADADQHFGAGVTRDQADVAGRRLARRYARFGVFEAVIGGVADHVHERIGEPLDHRLVEFGLFAGRRQIDLLAEIARQIVDEAAETSEQRADRHHADAHHRVAQRRGQPFDLLGHALGAAAGRGELASAAPGR